MYTKYSSSCEASDVESILAVGSIDIVFQPIIKHTECFVFAFEALSRPRLNGKHMAPDVWFRSANAMGLSAQADLLSISCAVREYSTISHMYPKAKLFLNVVPNSLLHPNFVLDLASFISSSVLEPSDIVLEIIEQSTIEPPDLLKPIHHLRNFGFKIAIDDIGSGNSTLRAMVDLEPDFLKIDRFITNGVSRSNHRAKLIELLLDYMGESESVIAEGVEEAADVEQLRNSGVHLSQGYYWSPPITASSIRSFSLNCL